MNGSAAAGRLARLAALLRPPTGDLLHDPVYRRLWLSILVSAFGSQVTMLAVPLTAAVLLHASPTQMGRLTAVELAPFALFSLPVGVWLERVRKLPVYWGGSLLMAATLASVPLAWTMGLLAMPWLYVVAFVAGCVMVASGTAAQIVLTQIVERERLVEAHARNALANSAAEVAGPGLAGALIRLVGAPAALLADAALLLASVAVLAGLRVREPTAPATHPAFLRALREGLRFVRRNRLLLVLALLVGCWNLFAHAAMVVQVLFATRELGLNERQVGLCYVGIGVGTVAGSSLGHRISRRMGVGPSMLVGFALGGAGWLQLAFMPANAWGVAAFVAMLACFGAGAVLIFINFLALRQAVTPAPLLARMTSIMRWLILLPALPGALVGGWIGEHLGLRWSLACGGLGALGLAMAGALLTQLRAVRQLPAPALAPATAEGNRATAAATDAGAPSRAHP